LNHQNIFAKSGLGEGRAVLEVGKPIQESWSEEDYKKYFPKDFNPLEGGMKGWTPKLPANPDDDFASIWDYFKTDYLPRHYDLTDEQ
jgi:hypothetical protein